MKKFKAREYTDKHIVLESSKDLDDLYSTIDSEENFTIEWKEKEVVMSEIVISSSIVSKVRNGEIRLSAASADIPKPGFFESAISGLQ